MTGLAKYYCMNQKFLIVTEGSPDVLETWSFQLKKIKIFYITVSPVLKCFCSGFLCHVQKQQSNPAECLERIPPFDRQKSYTCTEILNLLSVVHECKTVLKFSFQLNFGSSGGLDLVVYLT